MNGTQFSHCSKTPQDVSGSRMATKSDKSHQIGVHGACMAFAAPDSFLWLYPAKPFALAR